MCFRHARDPADTRLNRKWQVFWLYPYPTRLPGQSSSDLVCRSCKKGLTASGNVADSHCIPVLAPTRALLNACIFNENAAWIWTVKNQMRCKDIKNYWTNQKKQEKTRKALPVHPLSPSILHPSTSLLLPIFLRRYSIVTPSLLHRKSIVSMELIWTWYGVAMEYLMTFSGEKGKTKVPLL